MNNNFDLIKRIFKDDINELINLIIESIDTQKNYIVCFNPHSFYLYNKDKYFRNAVNNAKWIIPDGIGIVIASKILNLRIHKRICGPDVFFSLMKNLNKNGKYTVFFLGSTNLILSKIEDKFKTEYSNLIFAGSYSPPFKDELSVEDNLFIINKINLIKPDILWIGMTQPKQEKWLFENINSINIKFAVGIGAFFDYYSDTIKIPNKVIIWLNLQWLHRLIQNPIKMWRRNLISTPFFIFAIFKIYFKKYFIGK